MNIQSFEDVLNEHGSLLWKCIGVSMEPLIREGRDYVYIQKQPIEQLKKYDVVLFKRPNASGRGRYVLHRILKINPDGTYWIVGDNYIGGEIVAAANILGVLTAMKRKGKVIYMTDFRLRLYTALWYAPVPMRALILRVKHLLKR